MEIQQRRVSEKEQLNQIVHGGRRFGGSGPVGVSATKTVEKKKNKGVCGGKDSSSRGGKKCKEGKVRNGNRPEKFERSLGKRF